MNEQPVRLSRCAVPAAMLVSVGLLLGGCSGASSDQADASSASQSAKALPVVRAYAELASGVTNLEELANAADTLVIARAGEDVQTADKKDPELVYTKQTFEITQVIWGLKERAGQSLDVRFTGGVVRGGESGAYMLELEGQPQFVAGTEYLLALLGPGPESTYMVLGGSQGRYAIVDSRLVAESSSEATADGERTVQGRLDGLDVDEASAMLLELRTV